MLLLARMPNVRRVAAMALGLLVVAGPSGRAWSQEAEAKKPADAAAKDEKKATPTIAVFKISGALKEKPSEDVSLFSSVGSTSLRDLFDRMEKAAGDEQVKAVVILLESPAIGTAQVEELRQAMSKIQAKGKPVYAHADELTTGSYALLSGASRLSVVPTADCWITGVRGEAMYLRGLFDKLGVEPDFLTCGAYKSAAETYMRSGPSPEAESMENWIFDSIYETFVDLIASGRKVDPAKVREWMDAGPYSAESALKNGLIDAVEHRQDFEAMLKKEHGSDVVFNRKYGKKEQPKPDFSSPFGVLKFYGELLGGGPKKTEKTKPSVAIVYVDGAIAIGADSGVQGLFSESGATSNELRRTLNEVADDDSIKAVVLRVDSPGGSAVASEIILDATARVKAKKPFVVSMGNVAGSGGYYVACASDTIFADRSTITASIGVVSGKLVTGGLLDRVGVNFHAFERGKNAGILAADHKFTPEERERMQTYMNEVYGAFKKHVTDARGDRLKKPIDELAGGRVFTGQQALELGLVDKLGTLDDAIDHIAEIAKLGTDYEVRTVPKAKNFLEVLLDEAEEKETDKHRLDVATSRPVRLPIGESVGILEMASPLLKLLAPERAAQVRGALEKVELIQSEGVLMLAPEYILGN
jgi:protease-4